MAKVGNIIMVDPTLDAMHKAIEDIENSKPQYKRSLGVSWLGEECERKMFYKLTSAPAGPKKASLIYAGEDGYRCEDVVAARLRLIPGIELWTKDEHNPEKQIGFKDMDGRLKGYADGVIRGLLQAPTNPHVWENKAKSVKLFAEFQKLKEKFGEKGVLREWNFEYFVQAQMLMGYLGLDRHYMTVCTQGARDIDSCRTVYDPVFFSAQRAKAQRILGTVELPERRYVSAAFFKCKFCDYADHCWKD